jgi:hypothetical protein
MYSVQEVMASIHADPVGISVAAVLVYLFGFAQYFYAVALQLRERKSPWFFWMHAWYIGHDLTFVSLYDLWFNQVDFWLFKVLWAGCVAFVFIELFVLYLTVKHERQEVFGRYVKGELSEGRAWIRGLCGYALGIALFYIIRIAIGDSMCLALMMSTNFIVAVFPSFLAEQRGSREGHSVVLALLVIAGTVFTYSPQGIGFWASASGAFRQPWYWALGAIAVFCSVRYLVILLRMPAKGPLPDGRKAIF